MANPEATVAMGKLLVKFLSDKRLEDYDALGKWLVEHPDYNPDEIHADSEYNPLGASYA